VNQVWKWLIAAVVGLLGLLALLGSGGNARLAAYLKKRDDAERRALAAADEALGKLNGHVADANKEINHAAGNPADAINRSGR